MLGQNLFDYFLEQKMEKLSKIRERNIMVRKMREMVNQENARDHRLAEKYDSILKKMSNK